MSYKTAAIDCEAGDVAFAKLLAKSVELDKLRQTYKSRIEEVDRFYAGVCDSFTGPETIHPAKWTKLSSAAVPASPRVTRGAFSALRAERDELKS